MPLLILNFWNLAFQIISHYLNVNITDLFKLLIIN